MDTMDRTNRLHWIAGFFEGEGCIHCNPRKSLLAVSANQKIREPLECLHEMLGGAIRPSMKMYRGEPRPIFTWTVVGSRAAGVAMTLYPLLSTRRKEQIRDALDRWKSHRAHHRHWTMCKYGHPFTEDNVYIHPTNGSRKCKTCIRDRNRGYEQARRRAAGSVPRAKITPEDVRVIRRKFAEGVTQRSLCEAYGLTQGTMHHIVHGLTWKHVV